MNRRDRLADQFRRMQGDMVPSIVRAFNQDDLQMIHSAVLFSLVNGERPTIKELAERIDRSVSRTSRLVEHLVSRGLVQRLEDADDRRVRRVCLSEQGDTFMQDVQRLRVDKTLRMLDQLSEAEQAVVDQAMELLAVAARRLRDDER
jgi:DNA-binding MarR family transcriptional regulator